MIAKRLLGHKGYRSQSPITAYSVQARHNIYFSFKTVSYKSDFTVDAVG
jgi:hypothetical protein